MSDPNTSPVSLPAGSYDMSTLQKGLDKAAKGSAKGYDDAVVSAIADASTNMHVNQDARDIPGYKFVDVENELGGTENVQVFDAKLDEQAAAADDAGPDTPSEADLRNNQAQVAADAVAKADNPGE